MLKYRDPVTKAFHDLAFIAKGEKGDKGDKGDPGVHVLDELADVSAPSSTPAGKVLGTTSTGQWAPVSALVVRSLLVEDMVFTRGVDVGGGKLLSVGDPGSALEGANKRYVDSRIWTGTQAQYDAAIKDPAVLYVVVG